MRQNSERRMGRRYVDAAVTDPERSPWSEYKVRVDLGQRKRERSQTLRPRRVFRSECFLEDERSKAHAVALLGFKVRETTAILFFEKF